ncbi:hypothetical protein F4780DRAFT_627449 [Xylariomycetidae sp. FL0641]|nr:hypothetical protein F4780DRAFT_627449 [Xylariomycetidae sp. FL0641]
MLSPRWLVRAAELKWCLSVLTRRGLPSGLSVPVILPLTSGSDSAYIMLDPATGGAISALLGKCPRQWDNRHQYKYPAPFYLTGSTSLKLMTMLLDHGPRTMVNSIVSLKSPNG